MSPGYPARRSDIYPGLNYSMFFGGLPPHTYTTIRLHSSPSLLSGGSLQMSNGLVGDWSYLGFSSEMHTPISVFMENGNIINIYDKRVSSNGLHPAFLFSFEGKCCIVVATMRANDSQNHVQHCWYITSFVGRK